MRGHRLSSTVLSQDCLGVPTLRCQSLGGPRMHDWRAREWSWLRCLKKDRRRPRIVSDKNGCPVRVWTSSFETKSVQWIWRIRLRHQLSSASIFFDSEDWRGFRPYTQIHRGILAEYRHYTAGAWFPGFQRVWGTPDILIQSKHGLMDKSGTSLDFQLAATWAMDKGLPKGAKIYKWLNDLHFIPLNTDTLAWGTTTTQVPNLGFGPIVYYFLHYHNAKLSCSLVEQYFLNAPRTIKTFSLQIIILSNLTACACSWTVYAHHILKFLFCKLLFGFADCWLAGPQPLSVRYALHSVSRHILFLPWAELRVDFGTWNVER